MKKITLALVAGAALALSGCAQFERGWNSWKATSFGSDWIVVQYATDGKPFMCWRLEGASVSSEENSDGIFWQDPAHGNAVHIAGWYNHVQVEGKNFANAAHQAGVDEALCKTGKYPAQ